jgi:type IV pilus assembly protein PilB
MSQKLNEDLLVLLQANSVLTAAQAATAAKQLAQTPGKNIEDVLIAQKFVTVEQLTEVKAKTRGVAYASLLDQAISKHALNTISEEVAKNYQVICFNRENQRIDVGVLDMGNLKALEAINFLAKEEGLSVRYFLISKDSFQKALRQYETISEEVKVALDAQKQETEESAAAEQADEKTEEITKAAPISKIVSVILRHAVEGKASDIHIEPYQQESRVRYRIDGILHTSLTLPLSVHDSIVARIKVLANLKLDETRTPQDGRIRLSFGDKRIDFRVSILPLIDSEKVAMRILDVSSGAPKLTDLGFDGRNLKIIEQNIKKTDGILLVTGPTGSGKSTTLFSILNMLVSEGVNISTLEDPVEYFLEGANQAQIRNEVGFSFATGLRALLRQDPDIIMVGEIRDNETAELAIHAALTGHMVLSTLHTNDALGAIPRLIDMEVEPFLLSSTINGVLAQRLVRRICPHCKTGEIIDEETRQDVVSEVKKIYDFVNDETKKLFDSTVLSEGEESRRFYKGKGCSRCGDTGYQGRVSISELLDVTDEVRELIAGKKDIHYDAELLKKQKFITVKQDGIIRALQGVTSFEEVLRVMSD